MAIGYYRVVLSIGVKLMVMGLLMGLGNTFLQNLIAQTAQSLTAGALSIIFVACIILALLAHRLPQTVADIAFGSHTGGVGAPCRNRTYNPVIKSVRLTPIGLIRHEPL
jgi:type IV secretory pathway TrbL component